MTVFLLPPDAKHVSSLWSELRFISLFNVTRFHCINVDIQNSTHSIYSESRKKSPIAQMLLLSAPLETKNFLWGQLLYVIPYMSATRGPNVLLYSIHPPIQCSGIEYSRSVFHIACIT